MSQLPLSAATAAPCAPALRATGHPTLASSREDSCILRTVTDLRRRLRDSRAAGLTVALVPTMGALHRGHLSLVEAARRRCDLVVVSVFVNPIQFDEQADLLAYPRNEARDAELARHAGADLIFAPEPEEMYRPGFSSSVQVRGLTDRLEGAVRGTGHFTGVTTVVCKLLNIVAPDVAFFGQKDAQQAAVLRRMVSDLDIETGIETLPIVREPDGLAMSSRNTRLSEAERERALALYAALRSAERLASAGERSATRLIDEARQMLASFSVQPEYIALVDGESFEDLDRLDPDGLMLIAARIGQTRLIDNLLLSSSAAKHPHPRTQDPEARKGAVIAPCSA